MTKKSVLPQVVYVEFDEDGYPVAVASDPNDAEDNRESDNTLAQYKLVSAVRVEFEARVILVKEPA